MQTFTNVFTHNGIQYRDTIRCETISDATEYGFIYSIRFFGIAITPQSYPGETHSELPELPELPHSD